ncbi:phosphoenolpyruvate--protein phosphotransferase [Cellulomonas denverensis]|uniref:Phosphoenolpyruvate-protein phosphotransferase n=1 Tax=Cellulomonas denverensis TaxID=264297 RepID=A0A7X6KW14_9CELL|nr:phosphoenolpyruvate--protein phosphotransferase [Cellulomonas denverensis]NKY23286.1 phosphoenolpyruvate--protein phosphotransferase [Cellulomonas denverensis]GIG26404.1 phosphoenolpyruvate-protein phosphotransferase [Cellulomonas denverensis]
MAPRTLTGVGVGRGLVLGPVAVARPAIALPPQESATPGDLERVTAAFHAVAADLQARADAAEGTLAEVLGATAQMAEDPALLGDVEQRIGSGTGPAHAVHEAVEQVCEMFTAVGGYMAERVTDLRSVKDRVIARVLDAPEPGLGALEVPSVVVAEDLSPADTSALDLDKVLGIVTEQGGPTGHTAIIAGQLGLPCLVRVAGVTELTDGTVVVVDAAAGTVTVDPDEALAQQVTERRAAAERLATDTAPGATSDGHRVQLLANIGTAADAERAALTAVEGVGLFRTEVLFLEQQTAPTVEDQLATYTAVLRSFAGRKVVVRTIDAGADKPLAFAQQSVEENPALGVRGYRLVRTLPQLLADQLTALGRAQEETGAELWVMAPMIATPTEAADFAAAARAAGLKTVGVMVEVPAVALRCADVLAEVDFVSLGTNDLAQYTMATDRLRGELSDLLDMWQPAVIDLVAATADGGKSEGKPVGVCGESASDPLMALVLTGLGVTSLSMSPAAVPAVRAALRGHTLARCQEIAAAARAARTAPEARAAALALTSAEVRDLLGL